MRSRLLTSLSSLLSRVLQSNFQILQKQAKSLLFLFVAAIRKKAVERAMQTALFSQFFFPCIFLVQIRNRRGEKWCVENLMC